MKLGCIYTCFAMEDLIEKSLEPWINYKDDKNEIVISSCSCPFLHFESQDNTKTLEKLIEYKSQGKIDSILTSKVPISEIEARNGPLKRLIELGCSCVAILDSDEEWSQQEIKNLFEFLEKEQNGPNFWYCIFYKNLVFDGTQFMTGFDPARVYWVKKEDYILNRFIDDNDCAYSYKNVTNFLINCKELTNTHIPKELICPLHMSWLDSERSRKKLEYQLKRGWFPNFKWNYETNKLEFNLDYYKQHNKELPKLYKLNENQ